ncbi:precorrin-3B synthase [Segnochrobactraceae bacterium EtOH-i3]
MTHPPAVRGFCPGARRPMMSGDGLIVRLRPPAGRLSLTDAHLIALKALEFGNGRLDVTRRAGLQIRGARPDSLPDLTRALDAAGLLDADVTSEAARSLIVPPLAGCDPDAALDAGPLISALEARMATHAAFRGLPPKLGTLLDDGGRADLSATRADIRLEALAPGRIRVGLDGAAGPDWLGTAPPARIPDILTALAGAIARAQPPEGRARVRTLLAQPGFRPSALAAARAMGLDPAVDPAPRRVRPPLVGHLALSDGAALAVIAPFGRISAEALVHLASLAPTGDIRLAPEHGLIRTGLAPETARQAVRALSPAFITRAADPLLSVTACAGRPDCASAHADVRTVARAVAPFARRLGPGVSVHVSGCAKGCARDAPARLTATATPDGFALIPHGRADGVATAHVASSAELAAHLLALGDRP